MFIWYSFVFYFKFKNYIRKCTINVGETKKKKHENKIVIWDELIKKPLTLDAKPKMK